MVDVADRRASQIPLLSTFKSATESFARTMGAEVGNWRMVTSLLDQTNCVVRCV
jgi:hypothetical protein